MPTKVTIKSRGDFRYLLAEAIELVGCLSRGTPNFPTYENIARQLSAMAAWTDGDRVPSDEEQRSIDVGLVASRELDTYQDPQIQDLCSMLYALNAFFGDFPKSVRQEL